MACCLTAMMRPSVPRSAQVNVVEEEEEEEARMYALAAAYAAVASMKTARPSPG